jgi:hypothetical protein
MSLFEDDLALGRPFGFELATGRTKKRAGKSGGSRGTPSTTGYSFTVTTSAAHEAEEDKADFDWDVLRKWASTELDSTSQARMLFESEKKNQMRLDEAAPKFIMIKRLLEDELKRRAIR